MKILLIEPEKVPEAREINRELHIMQELVYPFSDPVALVCNDEGKLLGLSGNRALRDEQGKPYDIICGPFLLCGAPTDCDHFTSLTEEQIETYRKRFEVPEMFLKVNGQIIVLPIL